MRYYPATLEMLLKFKLSQESELSDDLLVNALYLYTEVDYDDLYKYFCSGTKRGKNFVKVLKKRIYECCIWRKYNNSGDFIGEYNKKIDNDGLWLLEPKKLLSKDKKEMEKLKKKKIKEYRLKMVKEKEISQDEIIDNIDKNLVDEGSQNENIKEKRKIDGKSENKNDIKNTKASIKNKKIEIKQQNSFMKYIQVEKVEKKSAEQPECRFYPISYPPSTIIYDRTKNYHNYTIRKRDDIQDPVKLTFIQHFDRIRPPFLGKKQKFKERNTIKKLSLDYDYNSEDEWVIDEGEDLVSEEESTDSEDEESWIESDSEEINRKIIKKPTISISKCNFIKFKEYDINWYNLPLEKQKVLSDEQIEILKKIDGPISKVAKEFAEKFDVEIKTIVKILKEIQPK